MKLLLRGLAAFPGLFLVTHLSGQTPPSSATYSTRGGVAGGSAMVPESGVSVSGPVSPRVHVVGVPGPGFERGREEMEMVTFLGVETSRLGPAFATQLSLQEGTGLLVTSIDTGSPAAAVFKLHDILLKLDDQILIVQEQLSVLIRGHKEGDEVAIAYLRAGRPATAKVKLGKHETPKMNYFFEEPGWGGGILGINSGGGVVSVSSAMPLPPGFPPPGQREADRLLSLMPHGPGGELGLQTRIENLGPPGMRAMSVDPGNSKLVYSDDTGSLELTIKDGRKSLVARDPKGADVFSGPVTTPEERKAMPGPVRDRLEKFEGMQDSVFQTDGQFKGAETKMIMPHRRSI